MLDNHNRLPLVNPPVRYQAAVLAMGLTPHERCTGSVGGGVLRHYAEPCPIHGTPDDDARLTLRSTDRIVEVKRAQGES